MSFIIRFLMIVSLYFLFISCKTSSKINVYGEWRGVDIVTKDSISLILMVKDKVEMQIGKNHKLYGEWRIDNSSSGDPYIKLKVFDPYKSDELFPIEPLEIIESWFYKNKLRMKNQTILEQDCNDPKNISEPNTLYGNVQKVVYLYQEAPDLYYQNYKLVVTPAQIRVIIHNYLGTESILDRSYPLSEKQFKKIAEDIEFISVDNNDFKMVAGCECGTLEELLYYDDCGIILKGLVYNYGREVFGNVISYIYLLESNMKQLIPQDAKIFDQADRKMDSLMVQTEFRNKYLRGSLFNILGMLGEYISRFYAFNGKPIPYYIIDFGPDDKSLINYFEKCIEEYKMTCPVDFDYTKELKPYGYIRFNSVKLVKIINAFYIDINSTATLDSTIFNDASIDDMLNYIEGAYLRFGIKNKNRIVIANAYYKIKTIAMVLKKLGCTDVITYSIFSIPTGNSVIFKPNKLVRNRLKIKHILNKRDIQPDIDATKELMEEWKSRGRN